MPLPTPLLSKESAYKGEISAKEHHIQTMQETIRKLRQGACSLASLERCACFFSFSSICAWKGLVLHRWYCACDACHLLMRFPVLFPPFRFAFNSCFPNLQMLLTIPNPPLFPPARGQPRHRGLRGSSAAAEGSANAVVCAKGRTCGR